MLYLEPSSASPARRPAQLATRSSTQATTGVSRLPEPVTERGSRSRAVGPKLTRLTRNPAAFGAPVGGAASPRWPGAPALPQRLYRTYHVSARPDLPPTGPSTRTPSRPGLLSKRGSAEIGPPTSRLGTVSPPWVAGMRQARWKPAAEPPAASRVGAPSHIFGLSPGSTGSAADRALWPHPGPRRARPRAMPRRGDPADESVGSSLAVSGPAGSMAGRCAG
jgi:hypothetical protein